MNRWTRRVYLASCAAAIALTGGAALGASNDDPNVSAFQAERSTQTAELHRLQAAFHREASIHDPVNGDSEDALNQRIAAMLSLWTEDGWLWLDVGGARDGYYLGKGDLADPSACPPPSTSYGNRGTLCTFFKYVAGFLQPANKWVSLAPSYKTRFRLRGPNATVYFECHYFNVAMDPATGRPLWAPVGHTVFDGGARLVEGRWRLSFAHASAAGVPIP
jgi:hypothetical protein